MTSANRVLTWILGILFALLIITRLFTIYTDYLWMDSLGQAAVFLKLFWTKLLLGLVIGAVVFVWLRFNLRLARRKQPEDVTLIGKRLLPDEDREQIEQFADRALFLFALIGGLYVALFTAPRHAMTWLRFNHAVPFGQTDPIFGMDAGFFVFRMPWWEFVYSTVFGLLVATLISVVLVHLYQENIRLVGNTLHANRWARLQCLGLLALTLIVKVFGYRLDQFRLLYSTAGGEFSGATYADVYARLPMLWVMIVVALIAAVMLLMTIRRRDFKLAGWALGVLVVMSLVGASIYPSAIQRLVVLPNELAVETPFIERNIKATRYAFDLDRIERTTYRVSPTLAPETLQDNRETLKSIRLWDYRPLEATYDTWEALRAYYGFPGIYVDRYRIDGELRQVSISSRQLDYNKLPSQTWVNRHLVYTHGYGAVVSPVNEADPSGLPVFWLRGLPPRPKVAELSIDRGGLYYMASSRPPLIELISSPETLTPPQPQQPAAGPQMPGQPAPAPAAPVSPLAKQPAGQVPYVLVNTKQPELDYPLGDDSAGETLERHATTHYSGEGGIVINSFFRRLAFALRFMDIQILLTNYLNPDSRIQINRYLPEALSLVAPFLDYDPSPYLVIADGKLKWICDSYTSTSRYPYSTPVARIARDLRLPINYLRNPVKIVVDAYDGIPEFFVVDPTDPIVQCYQQIFPGLFTDKAQMPQGIRQHLRYPLLQFMIQAKVYGLYHMTEPALLYSREDHWTIPQEIYFASPRMMEPYYVVMRLPGADEPQFIVMMPYVLKQREDWISVAWMAAICDEPDYGRMIAFDFPKGTTVMGPMQFEARVNQDSYISQQFTLWSQEGVRVIRGNTLMIPLNGSLLYVEPVFLVSIRSAVPELKQVIMAFGDQIVMESSLDLALHRLFGENLRLAEAHVPPTERPAVAPDRPAPAAPLATDELGRLREVIEEALRLQAEADQALSRGDLAGYQEKQREQAELLQRAGHTLGE